MFFTMPNEMKIKQFFVVKLIPKGRMGQKLGWDKNGRMNHNNSVVVISQCIFTATLHKSIG